MGNSYISLVIKGIFFNYFYLVNGVFIKNELNRVAKISLIWLIQLRRTESADDMIHGQERKELASESVQLLISPIQK
jgi:hypothetical protein